MNIDFSIKKVVFDIDDTLWGLNKRIANVLNIDENKLHTFVITDNKLLTEKEKNRVLNEYHNEKIFENIDWYDGIENILKIKNFGVQVFINSNCMTQTMANNKINQLLQVVDIPKENIKCNIIESKSVTRKTIDLDTDILIDDSPYNIANSPAKLNIIINHPWNITDEAEKIMKNKKIIRFDNLNQVNNFLIEICKT